MMPAQQSARRDTISNFLQRVERACADLPNAQRRRILSDLDAHLREMEGRSNLLAELGDPDEYARELRAAMNLPPATPEPAARTTLRRWLPAAIVLAVAAAAVAAVLVVKAASSSEKPHPAGPSVTTSPARSHGVTVPNLVGLRQASAVARAKSLGLTVAVENVTNSAVPQRLVVAQNPVAYTFAARGMTITLRVSAGR